MYSNFPTKLTSPFSLALNLKGGSTGKCVSLYTVKHPAVKNRSGESFFLSAVAAETDVDEYGVDENEEGAGAVATIPPAKIKKGKAVLPLYRDRVDF